MHHFFGYYDKSPWNTTGTRLLCHQTAFTDRPPSEEDAATIGMVHLDDGNRFESIAKTWAWNFQQGAMLRWHPAAPNQKILYNDRRNHRFVAIEVDLETREERVFERPVYAVTPDGRTAFSLNFSRLQDYRRGYGYPGVPDPWRGIQAPEDDGVHRMDLETGTSTLLVSLAQLAALNPRPEMANTVHWVNHLQTSPTGRRVAFLHRWRIGEHDWGSRLYCLGIEGDNLRCLLDGGMVSHYDWRDDNTILVWARDQNHGDRFLWVDIDVLVRGTFAEESVKTDGHCSFSPDRSWVLNDTYPDEYNMRTLMVLRSKDEKRINLARLFAPPEIRGELRCDLHPRWRRDGRQVCIDSLHSGHRQVYIVDLPSIVTNA
jgi:hypothetical protein